MLRTRASTLFSCAALLLLGCTADNPDVAPDLSLASTDMSSLLFPDGGLPPDLSMTTPPGTIADECVKLATAVCNQLNKCSPFELRYYYGDTATCAERVQLTCAPYVQLTGSSWTVDRLRACTAGYTNGTCTDYFAPDGPAACHPQPGTLAEGAACANSNQCKSALCNTGVTGCGTCVTPIKSGQACTGQRPCETGTSCVANKCTPPGGKGDACGNGKAACQTGFYCKTNACTPALGVGATCTAGATTPECDAIAGLHCDAASLKCVAYKVVDSGTACGQTGTDYTLCAAGGSCTGTAPNSKCVAAAMDSSACGTVMGSTVSCMLPATCTTAVCHVFDPATCK